MKSLLLIPLVLMFAGLAHAEPEESLELKLPAHIQKQCEEAGGCVLVPRAALAAQFEEVHMKSLMEGYIAGATEAADKGCHRAI